MADAAPDDGSSPNEWNPGSSLTVMEGDALNVSVISLGGEVLVIVSVSSRCSVWELKGFDRETRFGKIREGHWDDLALGPPGACRCSYTA